MRSKSERVGTIILIFFSDQPDDCWSRYGERIFQIGAVTNANNRRRAKLRIDEAAANGAQVVLLPEAMDLGWTHPSALSEAQPIPDGETCRMLMQKASQHRIYVCSGLTDWGKVWHK